MTTLRGNEMCENDDRIYADEFDQIVHPNGTTAWEAAFFAAMALEYTTAEVVQGWDGINSDESERIMRATVRKLVKGFCEALDGIDDPRATINRAAAANAAPEVISIPDAAAECGMTVEEFIRRMAEDGVLIEHPNGGYIPSPHPDIRPLGERW